jgi:hypothetical protein
MLLEERGLSGQAGFSPVALQISKPLKYNATSIILHTK